MSFPSPPWDLRGDLWLSLFVLPRGSGREPGLHGAALVDYRREPGGGVLAYHELLVARPLPARRPSWPRVRISDIWVDSAASLEGGRALWSIPKGLAELPGFADAAVRRRVTTSVLVDGVQVAEASFARMGLPLVGRVPVRVPVRFATSQPRLVGDGVVEAQVSGSARVLPARATWDVAPDGRLGFLTGHRPVLSLLLADFRLTFGA